MAAKKTFRASKVRQRKVEPTDKIGPVLIPSYALEVEYKQELYRMILEAVLPTAAVREGYAEDRLTVNSMKLLREKAFALATRVVQKVNRHSATTTWEAIEALGKESLTVGKAELSATLRNQIALNVDLITNLAEESNVKLTELYEKHGVDQKAIYEELKETVGNRAKLIARDQNAKIFTSLNTERMLSSGLDTFIWDHSSAGKTPRVCHEKRSGHEFSLKGGPAELYFPDGSDANQSFGAKKGDYGKPGYAINCRCRMRPKVSLDD